MRIDQGLYWSEFFPSERRLERAAVRVLIVRLLAVPHEGECPYRPAGSHRRVDTAENVGSLFVETHAILGRKRTPKPRTRRVRIAEALDKLPHALVGGLHTALSLAVPISAIMEINSTIREYSVALDYPDRSMRARERGVTGAVHEGEIDDGGAE